MHGVEISTVLLKWFLTLFVDYIGLPEFKILVFYLKEKGLDYLCFFALGAVNELRSKIGI